MTFRYSHRVTYSECTLGDHVYYARFLDLLEGARGDFFRHLGVSFLEWQRRDTLFPVVECRLRYFSAAHYDDLITVGLRVSLAAGARLNFAYAVVNESGGRILEAETWHACTNVAGKPRRLPAELIDRVQPYSIPLAASRTTPC